MNVCTVTFELYALDRLFNDFQMTILMTKWRSSTILTIFTVQGLCSLQHCQIAI